ncbi:MAG: adenylate cyclase [Alphaproteobacteria bacterium]
MVEERVQRRLAAILAADVVGYSRLIRTDESGTRTRYNAHINELIDPSIAEHGGRTVKTTGDGFLVEFTSVVDAVQCAAQIQRAMPDRNAGELADRSIAFRIGINLGDVIIEGDDIHGDGVNTASRLEGLSDAGGMCISAAVYDQVRDRIDLVFEDLGDQEVKNIDRPVRAWRWTRDASIIAEVPASSVASLPLPDKPSIAVLPFQTMAGDPDQDYLADGVVEAITAALSRIRSFFVIARNSASTFKGRMVNVIDIGRELGVAYALEGSVQRAGDRIRITVQLVETKAGAHIWAEHYDGHIGELFDLQDRITERVAGELQPSIRLAEIERSRRKRPQDQNAYDYTMRAMPHVWALEQEESEKALNLLDKALSLDPDFPLALSLAAWCHAQRSVYNWSSDIADSQSQALTLAERAAALSGDDPLILAVLGAVHSFVRNFGTARILLERAVTLDPNSAWAWQRLGWLENYSDRPEHALEHFERAMRLSPLDPMNFNIYVGMGSANEVAERYDEAAANYQRALEERPHAVWIYRSLASSLSGASRTEEAKQAYSHLMQSYPDLTGAKVRQAMVFSEAMLDRMIANLKKLGLPD